jgi:hypothetical protein
LKIKRQHQAISSSLTPPVKSILTQESTWDKEDLCMPLAQAALFAWNTSQHPIGRRDLPRLEG